MDNDSRPVDEQSDLNSEGDEWVFRFVDKLLDKHGDAVQAIVLYGSYTRGERDTVLDFYVLFDRYDAAFTAIAHRLANRFLPPNVYYLSLTEGGESRAAKYATVTLAQFEDGINRRFHSYFWARFAQPITIAYVKDPLTRRRLTAATRQAGHRMIGATIPMLSDEFSTEDLWVSALALTYGCELRAEDRVKARELFNAYKPQLIEITSGSALNLPMSKIDEDRWRGDISRGRRGFVASCWWMRKVQGKLLSIARLFKAAFTFNDPLGYIVWKVERHSGVYIEPSALQRRHPLLFGWGLLWRLYRRGGFR